jgi:hypothetical protein
MSWSADFDQAGALARWIPTSLRSVSGAIRQYTFREVVAATLRNRFRYWDLEERCADVQAMGFQSFRAVVGNASGRWLWSNLYAASDPRYTTGL